MRRKPLESVKIGQDISLTHKKKYFEDGSYTWEELPKKKWKYLN